MTTSVTVITNAPSFYQVQLFNAVANRGDVDLAAVYVNQLLYDWSVPDREHQGIDLFEGCAAKSLAAGAVASADLVVFNWYDDRDVAGWMRARAASGRPWAFWGERPGFRLPGFLGRWARRVKLSALHRSRAPIWGKGQWAVDAYRAEFGTTRHYENVPYYSDLEPFLAAGERRGLPGKERTFLFSGALIPRKGVDRLARAFEDLALFREDARLVVLGEGELHESVCETLASCATQVDIAGHCDWNALPEYYAQGDILVAPSLYDGWGLIIPEALAAGMPVIATDRMGSAIDLIEPGRNGWIIPAGDQAALRGAMLEALDMPAEKLQAMSRAAVETARGHSLQAGAERFASAVRDSIAAFGTT